MATRISSVRDLQTWAAQSPEFDDQQAARIARAIWKRDDFPHPVNNTDVDEYLADLPDEWIYEVADDPQYD